MKLYGHLQLLTFVWLVITTGPIHLLATEEAVAVDNSDCFLCHEDADLKREGGEREGTSLYVAPKAYGQSVHGPLACMECHRQMDADAHPDTGDGAAKPVRCANCHEEQSATYGRSAHGSTSGHDGGDMTSCTDCHGVHAIRSPSDIQSPLHFLRLTETCGKCHEEVAADILASVHGSDKARGRRESPVCTDCHTEHAVAPLSSAAAVKQSGEVCAQCHSGERLNTKYGIAANSPETYDASYHGLATRLGSTEVANCASCHGYHLILPSEDSLSSIHPSQLTRTCGECHPGATERFVSGGIHHPSAEPGKGDYGAVINYYVKIAYKLLIVLVIGAMLFHNGLAWRAHVHRHLRNPKRTVVRMNRSLRIQHALLAGSFIFLAISGFALAYPESIFAWLLGSNEEIRRWSHRIIGVGMLLLGLYHCGYLCFTHDGRQLLRDFLPKWQDAKDIVQNVRHYLGLTPHKAGFARFGYPEKLEYWAVFWGTLIMGATGAIIWLKLPVTSYLPRWVIEVATTVHFYEAVLAVLAIIVWHLYHIIFDPAAYPMNGAWLDGKVTPEWMKEEHPKAAIPDEDGGGKGKSGGPAKDDKDAET